MHQTPGSSEHSSSRKLQDRGPFSTYPFQRLGTLDTGLDGSYSDARDIVEAASVLSDWRVRDEDLQRPAFILDGQTDLTGTSRVNPTSPAHLMVNDL
jgi:hypothetical protein